MYDTYVHSNFRCIFITRKESCKVFRGCGDNLNSGKLTHFFYLYYIKFQCDAQSHTIVMASVIIFQHFETSKTTLNSLNLGRKENFQGKLPVSVTMASYILEVSCKLWLNLLFFSPLKTVPPEVAATARCVKTKSEVSCFSSSAAAAAAL